MGSYKLVHIICAAIDQINFINYAMKHKKVRDSNIELDGKYIAGNGKKWRANGKRTQMKMWPNKRVRVWNVLADDFIGSKRSSFAGKKHTTTNNSERIV